MCPVSMVTRVPALRLADDARGLVGAAAASVSRGASASGACGSARAAAAGLSG